MASLALVLHADEGPPVTEIGAATLELLLLERLPACALVTRDDVPVFLDDLRAWFRWSVAHPTAREFEQRLQILGVHRVYPQWHSTTGPLARVRAYRRDCAIERSHA